MSKNDSVLKNLTWKFSERILAQLVSTIVSVILARLLEPECYGIISLVMIFITLANVLVSDGIGSALIQKKNADSLDFSTLLLFNVFVSLLIYFCIFFGAPYISMFYENKYDSLVPVLRILGIRVILTGVNSIQHAYISKNMMFRKFFWSTLIGTVLSAFVGIFFAYLGFGVWALVFQYLTNTTVDTIVLTVSIGKFPKLCFSKSRLASLLRFGVKILGTNLFGNLYNQIRAFIIGKVYTPNDLAFFDKGQQFPSLIVTNINSSITAVLFPKMASEQNEKEEIKQLMRRSLRFSSFLLSPMLIGMAAVAPQFVTVILTDKWKECVPLMQLLCFYYLFWPIHSINMQSLKALGEGNKYLKLEIVKKIIDVILLLITFQKGIVMIAAGMVVSSVFSVIINAYPNKQLIGYSIREQFKDILPSLASAILMGTIVCLMNMIKVNALILMVLQVCIGCVVYISVSALCKNQEFCIIVKTLKSKNMRVKKHE